MVVRVVYVDDVSLAKGDLTKGEKLSRQKGRDYGEPTYCSRKTLALSILTLSMIR